MRGPTTSLNENTSPGWMIVPSMKSAIRWTLWIRFDDDSPICVVYETSFCLIPSAFAFAVVRSGALGPSVISAAPPSAAAAATADATCGADRSSPGLRRNDPHALPLHDEAGVLRADDPLAEARPEDRARSAPASETSTSCALGVIRTARAICLADSFPRGMPR